MTASEQAKMVGLKNLKEMSELTGQRSDTLGYWSRNSPKLFEAALKRAVEKKDKK